MKHRLSSRALATPLTPEQIARSHEKTRMLNILGIELYFDSGDNMRHRKLGSYKSIGDYESIEEYEHDKDIATDMIITNRQVPKELFNRLLATKRDIDKQKQTDR